MSGRKNFDVPGIADRIHGIPVDAPSPGDYRRVPIGDIEVRPQVREVFDEAKLDALKAVIERDGQRQPLECYYEDGRYVLLTGERRYRAIKELGKNLADVKIKKKPGPVDAIYLQISENEDREPLTRIELAKAISSLSAAGEKTPAIAKHLGLGEKQVPRYRTVGNASERVHSAYDKGVVDIRSLEMLANIDKSWPEAFDEIAQSVVSGAVGRTELESIHARLKRGEAVSTVVSASNTQATTANGGADSAGSAQDSQEAHAGQEVSDPSPETQGKTSSPQTSPQDNGSVARDADELAGGSPQPNGNSPKKPDKSAISIDHHYEATHVLSAPGAIFIEVTGKLDNGVQIRGELLMDRVDEVSDFVWVAPDTQDSRPVKLEAKRIKIISVTSKTA